jgi:hypothetical protein
MSMQSTLRKCAPAAFVRAVLLILVAVSALSACGKPEIHFTEEVELANGEVIKVDRHVVAAPFGEVGGPGGWEPKYMSLEIVEPKRPENPPKWESSIGLLPILFDRDPDNGEWTLLATYYTCDVWSAIGRPKLPYAEFHARNGQWQGVALSEKWFGRAANVLTGISSSGEPEFIALAAKRPRLSDPEASSKYRLIDGSWQNRC